MNNNWGLAGRSLFVAQRRCAAFCFSLSTLPYAAMFLEEEFDILGNTLIYPEVNENIDTSLMRVR